MLSVSKCYLLITTIPSSTKQKETDTASAEFFMWNPFNVADISVCYWMCAIHHKNIYYSIFPHIANSCVILTGYDHTGFTFWCKYDNAQDFLTGHFKYPCSIFCVSAYLWNAISMMSIAGIYEKHNTYKTKSSKLWINKIISHFLSDLLIDQHRNVANERQGKRCTV